MKRSIGPARLVIAFVAVGLAGFATLAEAQTLPHYTVINLGILNEGSTSNASGVTNNGWVNGDSWLAGNQNEHAVLWRPDGMGRFKITDLGTLGGLNSASAWPSSSKNNRGLVVGQAQGPKVDPLEEYWAVDIGCGTSNGLCMGWQNLEFGFVWQNGVMTKFPPLGGYNSIANGVNNRGQVVGCGCRDQ
jgi:probable HAF family extracellular repeat protein